MMSEPLKVRRALLHRSETYQHCPHLFQSWRPRLPVPLSWRTLTVAAPRPLPHSSLSTQNLAPASDTMPGLTGHMLTSSLLGYVSIGFRCVLLSDVGRGLAAATSARENLED